MLSHLLVLQVCDAYTRNAGNGSKQTVNVGVFLEDVAYEKKNIKYDDLC